VGYSMAHKEGLENMNQLPERVLELRDLYEAFQILNKVGFNLSTKDLEREAHMYGFNLATLAKRVKEGDSQ
jgi:predicted ATP-grasp superfamily ATP-dependent carboligase